MIARVLARGTSGVGAFIAGFVVGDLVWFTLAAAGLAVIASTFAAVFLAIKWAGAAYLLWLAYRLWTTPPISLPDQKPHAGAERPSRLFLVGLSLTLGNPKVIVFFMALLPSLVDLTTLTALGFVEIAALIAVILAFALGTYAFAAARARRLFTRPHAMARLNRMTGAVLAGAAAVIVTK